MFSIFKISDLEKIEGDVDLSNDSEEFNSMEDDFDQYDNFDSDFDDEYFHNFDDDFESDFSPDFDDSYDYYDGFDSEEEDQEDPNFQGSIRSIRGAALVYKRQQPDGNYEELWIYNVGDDIKQETMIRRAILSGTDIAPNKQMSKDGSQKAITDTMGNVQFLKITGLPN